MAAEVLNGGGGGGGTGEERRGAAIVTSVVPNDGFPVGALVAVVIVVRAAKTSAVAPRSVYLFSLKNEMSRILLVL